MPIKLSVPFTRKRTTSQISCDNQQTKLSGHNDSSIRSSSTGFKSDSLNEGWDYIEKKDAKAGKANAGTPKVATLGRRTSSSSLPMQSVDVATLSSTNMYNNYSTVQARRRSQTLTGSSNALQLSNGYHSSPLSKPDPSPPDTAKSKFSLKSFLSPRRPKKKQDAQHVSRTQISPPLTPTESRTPLPRRSTQSTSPEQSRPVSRVPTLGPTSSDVNFLDATIPNEGDTVSVHKFRQALAMRSSVSLSSDNGMSTPKLELPVPSLNNRASRSSLGSIGSLRSVSGPATTTPTAASPKVNTSPRVPSAGLPAQVRSSFTPVPGMTQKPSSMHAKTTSSTSSILLKTPAATPTSISRTSVDRPASRRSFSVDAISLHRPPVSLSSSTTESKIFTGRKPSGAFTPQTMNKNGWKTADNSSDSDSVASAGSAAAGSGDDSDDGSKPHSNPNQKQRLNSVDISRNVSPLPPPVPRSWDPNTGKKVSSDMNISSFNTIPSKNEKVNNNDRTTPLEKAKEEDDDLPLSRLSMGPSFDRGRRSSLSLNQFQNSFDDKMELLGMSQNKSAATSTLTLPSQRPLVKDIQSNIKSSPNISTTKVGHNPSKSLSPDFSPGTMAKPAENRSVSQLQISNGKPPLTTTNPQYSPEELIILEKRRNRSPARSLPPALSVSNHQPTASLAELAEIEKANFLSTTFPSEHFSGTSSSSGQSSLDSSTQIHKTKPLNKSSAGNESGYANVKIDLAKKSGYDFGSSILKGANHTNRPPSISAASTLSFSGRASATTTSPLRSQRSSYFSALASPVSSAVSSSPRDPNTTIDDHSKESLTPPTSTGLVSPKARQRVMSHNSQATSQVGSDDDVFSRMKERHKKEVKKAMGIPSSQSSQCGDGFVQPGFFPQYEGAAGSVVNGGGRSLDMPPPGVDANLYAMLPPDQKYQLQQRGMMLMSMMAQAANQAHMQSQWSGSVIGGGSMINGHGDTPGMMGGGSMSVINGGNDYMMNGHGMPPMGWGMPPFNPAFQAPFIPGFPPFGYPSMMSSAGSQMGENMQSSASAIGYNGPAPRLPTLSFSPPAEPQNRYSPQMNMRAMSEVGGTRPSRLSKLPYNAAP